MRSRVKPGSVIWDLSSAIGTKPILRWHRIGSWVGFCPRPWGCVSKHACVCVCVRGCVGVLLHAVPQLSSPAYFIWWCMEVQHRGATLEVTNTPSPIPSTTTQVSTQKAALLPFSLCVLTVCVCERERESEREREREVYLRCVYKNININSWISDLFTGFKASNSTERC